MLLPQRKPTRLRNFDYSSVNYYFVTLCALDKKHYFGKIETGEMRENKIGQLIRQVWLELPKLFIGVALDEFVVMPNHVHGIIIFTALPKYRATDKPANLSQIVGALKSKTSVFARRQFFPERQSLELWQKTFYDRVIRNDEDLLKTREYIRNNVQKWELDEYFQ